MQKVSTTIEEFPVKGFFAISRSSITSISVLTVEIKEGEKKGRGECRPYQRYGQTVEETAREIDNCIDQAGENLTRETLQQLLPAGPARNALDCALWDLEAKIKNIPCYQLAGLPQPVPVNTPITISYASTSKMIEQAKEYSEWPLLKVKVSNDEVIEKLEGINRVCPDSDLIVDANEAWSLEHYKQFAHRLPQLKVVVLEQPFKSADDAVLKNLEHHVPVCADESCHNRSSLEALVEKYEMINIKLDKAGGLTEAIAMIEKAKELDLSIMIGSMLSTSLSIAPAFLLATFAKYVDFDGPLLLERERDNGLRYERHIVNPPSRMFWG